MGKCTALAPAEAVAPAVVLLVGGVVACIAAVALIVLVMHASLVSVVATETEARRMRTELDEAILCRPS